MLALYARVSTLEQNPDAQLDALHSYTARRGAEAREFIDHGVSGRKGSRPALDALVDTARRREVSAVLVTKLDRLARSVRHLTTIAAELEALGVDLIVLDQNIDTSTPAGRLLFNMLGAIGEFEHDLIVERTRAGLAAARRRGRHPGRPRVLDSHQVGRARRLAATGHSVRRIAEMLSCSPATAHRAVRR